jgi:predicted molibdopterin-dependent oxidoreductase YjgC
VFQDIFLNETARFAHVILPASSFAEKDGTFTNTERRVQKINKALEPIGNSKPDWQIICEIAKKIRSNGFDFNNPEEIMSEVSSVTPLYKNISYNVLSEGSLHLLCPDEENTQKVRFTPLEYRPSVEKVDIDYPLILIFERDIYSAGFLSRKVEGLRDLRTKGLVYLNPKDAIDFDIEDGKTVKIISRYGEIGGKVKVADISMPGIITMYLTEEEIQHLINPPQEQITESSMIKACAVKILPQKESQNICISEGNTK